MRRPEKELHHAAPRCLISLHEKVNSYSLDGEGIQAWLEREMEAMRWRVPVEITRADLEGLVETSGVVLERERHRLLHSSDWRRWGARGQGDGQALRLLVDGASGASALGADLVG